MNDPAACRHSRTQVIAKDSTPNMWSAWSVARFWSPGSYRNPATVLMSRSPTRNCYASAQFENVFATENTEKFESQPMPAISCSRIHESRFVFS